MDEAAHALRGAYFTPFVGSLRVAEGEFLRHTAPRWRRIARDLHHRWRKKLPAWVEPEDVEQELVLQVLRAVPCWDAERGLAIGRYVTWAAVHRAQREINRMRGARLHGNEGKNPGRPEATFSSITQRRKRRSADAPEFDPADLLPTEPAQFESADVREMFALAIEGAVTEREVIIFFALRECGGEPDAAALRIFADFPARVQCGARDEDHARALVRSAIIDLYGRLGSAA